jgi:HD-GYP domain-containing protein (c-di-GMP phosphodiesterase class II)
MATAHTHPSQRADVEATYDELLEVLGVALDFRDNETAGHSRRVTRFCSEIAQAMGCSLEQLTQINRGAYLHDLGKIAIPDAILFKKGKLTPQEWEVMRTHAWIGYNLVSRISLLAPVAEILLMHHEHYDGTGYPRGLKGDEISVGARIFAIADTLDAMTSDRPYRKAMPFSAAREEIKRESGRQFDPKAVMAFLAIPEDKLRAVLLSEKRRTVRLPFSIKVTCKVAEREHTLNSRNICDGGMLLEHAGGLNVGEVIDLQFTLPDVATPLKLSAKTVRRDLPDCIAVAFQNVLPQHRDAIRSYIATRVLD